ncbi:glycoside hydrolase family 16 protein [Apodospora peruviana]|uniref:chitinase n=1 Tax=Apodospora peruviana TaxID=516989 RepID=A0AAE0IUL8_9PEZI|nr:glycoside hydrolase family 16 protein [Apodospora peruviana]
MLFTRQVFASAIALLASSNLVQLVTAQVTTDCQPLNVTCPPNPALGMELYTHFNTTPKASIWETHVGTVNYNAANGAELTINKQGDSPTIRTKFYFFWGRTEIWMKASHGTGIISSIMFLSDDLDEIDWEFMGGDNVNATTNYFGKGHQDFHNGASHAIGGVQDDYHNYTTVWTKDALHFYIDTNLVRTLLPKDANNTLYYPQTPMRLSIGIWAGGDPTLPEGTRQWAGGDTDYSKGPYTMFVKSAMVEDFSSGKEYTYSDKTGSWQSIKISEGNSTVKEVVNAVPEKSVSEKFNELPSTSKIAIYASAAGVGGVLIIFALFYCIRQRRRGSREAKIAEAKFQAERLELDRFKKAGIDPDSFADAATEYNAKEMRNEGFADKDSYSVPNSASATPTALTGGGKEKWETAAAIGAGAGAGAAAAGAMRSPVPLLRDGAQSPRSPDHSAGFAAPYSDRAANTRSPAPSMHQQSMRSPPPMMDMRSPSPAGVPPQQHGSYFPPQQHPTRSFTNPNPQMRMGSPGPMQHPQAQQPAGFGMALPQPQRSFTTTGYPNPQQGGGYGQQQQQQQGGYWNGGGGYR